MRRVYYVLCLLLMVIQSPANAKVDLAEWELMKSYLLQIKKNTELQLQLNHAQYKFSKTVFKEYSKRWWELYSEEKKDIAIKKYWDSYFSGRQYSNEIKNTNTGKKYCRLIRAVNISSINPFQDEVYKEAFERGFKSYTPECYIPNIKKNIIKISKKIANIKRKLLNLKMSISEYTVSEVDLENKYNNIVEDLKKKKKEILITYKNDLLSVVNIPQKYKTQLKNKALQLSNIIKCDSLVSDFNEYYDCTLSFIKSEEEIDFIEAYYIVTIQRNF